MEIGTITAIAKDDGRLVCTVDFGAEDVITAILYGLASVSEYPMIDDEAAVSRGDDENIIVATFRPPIDGVGTGESTLYSRGGGGDTAATVKVCDNGQVKFNGGGRSIAAFDELKAGFDTFKSDFNSFVTTIYGPHIHGTTATVVPGTPGVISPTTMTGTPTSASIDTCESETVETL